MYPYHPGGNGLGDLDGQFQNISRKLPGQIPSSRNSVQDFPNHDFFGNQLPLKGSTQGQYGQQFRELVRSQLPQQQSSPYQQQHQSLDQSRHHQAQWEPEVQFSETSYSALLHGPDTPPFQPESSWDAPIVESGSHIAGGGTDASFQGIASNYNYHYNMQNDQHSEPQSALYTEPSIYVSGGQGLGFQPGISHALEHSNASLSLPPKINEGTTGFLMHAQNSQHTDQSFASKLHNPMDHLMTYPKSHPISNNQHQSHEIAFRQGNSWGPLDQNHGHQTINVADNSFPRFQNVERNSVQMHQYSTSIDTGNITPGLGHYQQSASILPEDGHSKHQQVWSMTSRGIPTENITNEIECQPFNSWNAGQIPKMHPDFTNHVQQPGHGKYNAWGTEALQNERSTDGHVSAAWPLHSSDSAKMMATSNYQPFQDGIYPSPFRQDSSIIKPYPPLETSDQYQGTWKNYPMQKQFQGVDTSYPSFNEGRNMENWAPEQQQRTNEVAVMKAAQMKSDLLTKQDPVRIQQHNYTAFPAFVNMQSSRIQTKTTQAQFANQHPSNFMKTDLVKSLPDTNVNRELPSDENDDKFEGPKVKRQREFSEFGNAHLLSRDSSITSRVQNMMPGLAPAGMTKNFLHTSSVGTMKYSGPQYLDRSLKPNIQSLSADHGVETEIDRRNDSPARVQWDLQRSAFLSNSPALIRQGNVMSEVPTQSGHGRIMNKDIKNVALNHSSVEQTQGPDVHPQGNVMSGPVHVGNDSRKLSYDIHSMRAIQSEANHDQAKVGNVPDMLTAWKSSFSQHPMQNQDPPKSFPEEMESVQSAFSGGQHDVTNTVRGTQINTKNSNSGDEVLNVRKPNLGTFYNEDSNFFPKQNIRNQSHEGQCIMPGKLPHEATFSSEGTLQTQMKLQMQRISTPLLSSPLNGLRPGPSLSENERQDRSQFMFPKPVPQQAFTPQRRLGKPSMEMSFPVQNQPQQPQTENETRSLHAQAHPGTWVPTAQASLNETVVKPLNDQSNSAVTGTGSSMRLLANDVLGAHQRQNSYHSEIRGQIIPSQSAGPVLKSDSLKSTHSLPNKFDFRGPGSVYSRFEQSTPSVSSSYQNPQNFQDGAKRTSLQVGEPIFHPRLTEEHQSLVVRPAPVMIHPKKRKNSVPVLFPWHVAATQPRGQHISTSKTELMWANAMNRPPEKSFEEIHNHNISRAKMRLRVATQLMQHLFPPDPSVLNCRINHINNECIVYNLTKVALTEACRMMANAEKEAEPSQKVMDGKAMVVHGQGRTVGMTKELVLGRITERFTERIKLLEKEFSRVDSLSGLDLKEKTYDLEKLSIVNRLSKTYGTGFLDSSENVLVEKHQHHNPGIRRSLPQRYVIPVPMPRTLPEDVRCLSL